MPKIADLTELFRAIGSQDWGAARQAARKIADAEERKGHRPAAHALRGALLANGTGLDGIARAATGRARTSPLLQLDVDVALRAVRMPPETRRSVERLVKEHLLQDRLVARGVRPRQSLLMVGPPGCGKTMTARAIAGELGLPAYLVRFDSLFGSLLGQTAAGLADVFTFAAEKRCVLVIDELDALGRQRGRAQDVGELDRIVIALMQLLEHSPPLGIVVATSNVPEQLDPALVRRFDSEFEFPAPDEEGIRRYLSEELQRRGLSPDAGHASKVTSYAQAAKIAEEAVRNQVLADAQDAQRTPAENVLSERRP